MCWAQLFWKCFNWRWLIVFIFPKSSRRGRNISSPGINPRSVWVEFSEFQLEILRLAASTAICANSWDNILAFCVSYHLIVLNFRARRHLDFESTEVACSCWKRITIQQIWWRMPWRTRRLLSCFTKLRCVAFNCHFSAIVNCLVTSCASKIYER